jgi:hypothetical protein
MSAMQVIHVVVSWRGLVFILAVASRVVLGDLVPHGRVVRHTNGAR